jgi:choline dehydrogenase
LNYHPNNLGYPSPAQIFSDTSFKSCKAFADNIRNSIDQWAQYYNSTNTTNAELLKKQYSIVASRYEEDYLSPIEINFTSGYGGTNNNVDLQNHKHQTIHHILIAPLSHSYIHINSSDIEATSIVNPQYYTHPMGIDVHVASTKLARAIMDAPTLASISSGEVEPGTNITSDDDVKQWLTQHVHSD